MNGLSQLPLGMELEGYLGILGFLLVAAFAVFVLLLVNRYKRCPSNKILVVFGKGVGGGTARCIHGGAALVWPLIQDYAYLGLEPRYIDVDLRGALTKKNIRVNIPAAFTIAIGTAPQLMQAAAERLLGLDDRAIQVQASEIIIGQLRQVIAMLSIEESTRTATASSPRSTTRSPRSCTRSVLKPST